MPLNLRALLCLILPPLFWAGNAVVGRLTVPLVPPLLLNALRWGITLAVLLALGWRVLAHPADRAALRARAPHLALLGLLGVGAYNAFQYLALTTSTPINVTLIASSMPLWMMTVGALVYRERPTPRQIAAAALSLAGVVTVLTRGDWASLARFHFVQGDLFILVAACCWALYSWMLARPPASMQGAQRPGVTQPDGTRRPWAWHEFLLVQTLFGLVWAGAAAGIESQVTTQVPQWTPGVAAALAYVVIGPSLLAYAFYGKAVALVGPTTASMFINLTPLFAALMSTLAIGEAPQPFHAVAFGLIVCGIVVTARK